MPTRERVYEAIDTERTYQDDMWTQADGEPNPLTVGEFLVLMDEYLAQARQVWSKEKKPNIETLHVVRKIAGIAVNCMEQNGAPRRAW